MFASLVVSTLTLLGRVVADPGPKSFELLTTETARLLEVYEAEVHGDVYRPDVRAALAARLARRTDAAARATQFYDAAALEKMDALTE